MNKPGNILSQLPSHLPEEIFETLVRTDSICIERIISHGQSTADGIWYDQERAEWVLLLQGEAGIQFEATSEETRLTAGDYLLIPPHCRHRVSWTAPDMTTVWLAIHFFQADTKTDA